MDRRDLKILEALSGEVAALEHAPAKPVVLTFTLAVLFSIQLFLCCPFGQHVVVLIILEKVDSV